jgi:hypothetical protein
MLYVIRYYFLLLIYVYTNFANLAIIDVAKPGVIPVVSATMGEAAHLVCTDSYRLGESKLVNNNCRIAKSAYN